ncbi:uncharacterized protein UHOD_08500 [Ustilago sp. UG-2017b]|nr:uncharacterized protein UHOD_08500 [Ustilago sp. UG-2017b]
MVRVTNAQDLPHEHRDNVIDWISVAASSEDLRATILELQDVERRLIVVVRTIDGLYRNPLANEASTNRQRNRLQLVQNALHARRFQVEERLLGLTDPRRYAVSPGSPTTEGQDTPDSHQTTDSHQTMDNHQVTKSYQAIGSPQDAQRTVGILSPIAPREKRDGDNPLESAWRRNDLEKVIELASLSIEEHAAAPTRGDHEGVRRLCANLRCRFKAYQAMKLFSLAVADAERVLHLVATYGDDLDTDMQSLFGNKPEGALATQAQEGSLKRRAADELSTNTTKRPRRNAEPQVHMPAIFRLSTELICSIADFIEPADRIRLANSCRQFRKIPQLWRQLVFRRAHKVPKEGWHRDTIDACITAIQTCQRRSYGALRSVELRGYINSGSLTTVFDALRPSFSTLKFLAIPAMDQKLCYNHLYQHCANLAGIDVRFNHRDSVSSYSPLPEVHMADKYSFFPPSQMPIKLSCFIADPSYDCGNISPHMQNLEIVQGITPKRQVQTSFIQGITSAAPTLREWIDHRTSRWLINSVRAEITSDQLPTTSIVFPRLRKLSAVWSQVLRGCEFPALEDLSFNAQQEILGESLMQHRSTQAVSIITRCPSLKKLHILLPSQASSQREIFNGIAQMEHLEELHIWVRKQGFTLQPLIDCQNAGNNGSTSAPLMLPSLQTLGLYNRDWPLGADPLLQHELDELLLMRFFLQKGCSGDEAKKRTAAALAAYDIHKTNKRQRKKLATDAVSAAKASVYPGAFEVHDGIKREKFYPVLPTLVVESDLQAPDPKGSDKLLEQLIATTIEDVSVTDHFWSCHTSIA